MEFNKFGASLGESNNFTSNNMNLFGICFGLEYSKTFRKGFLLAAGIDLSLTKGKKEGNWKDLNGEYDSQHEASPYEDKNGKLEKNALSPSVMVKCGYLLPEYKTVLSIKCAISRRNSNYQYKLKDAISKVNFNAFIPSVGLVAEKKINDKFGASLEVNFAMNKKSNRTVDGFKHKMNMKRSDIKLMGIYTISGNE